MTVLHWQMRIKTLLALIIYSFFNFFHLSINMSIFIPELLPIIFSHLPTSNNLIVKEGRKSMQAVRYTSLEVDFYKYMMVCKSWYSILMPIYYQEVTLKKGCKKFVQQSQATLANGSKIGDYVKTLRFSPADTETLNEQEFHELIRNLPQLQTLILPFRIVNGYEEYLKSVQKDYLEQIREISVSMSYRRSTLYYKFYGDLLIPHFLANYQFRNQVRSLTLPSVDGLIDLALNGISYNLLSVLPQFRNLTHLCISNVGFSESAESIHLGSILNACRNLISLEFYSNFPWYIQETSVVLCTSLTSLRLDIITMEEDDLHFIMRNIPSLKKFKLYFSNVDFPAILKLSTFNQGTVVKFGHFLQMIPYVDIRGFNYGPEQQICPLSHINETFWTLIQALSGKYSRCNLRMHSQLIKGEMEHFTIKKQNKSIGINAQWLLNIPDSLEIDNLSFSSMTLINSRIENLFSSMMPQSLTYLKIMNVLELLDRPQQNYPCSVLVKSRRQLVEFTFSKGSFTRYKSTTTPKEINENISRLWSQSRKGSSIKYGHIRKLQLTHELLELLSRVYPLVEELLLENCTVEKNEERKNWYSIDLRYFSNLQHLTIDFDAMLPIKKLKRPFYVRVTTTPCSSNHYQVVAKASSIDLDNINELERLTVEERAYVFEIHCNQLKSLTFKRHRSKCYRSYDTRLE